MKSSVGRFELDVPRDRNGSYEPQIVKNQAHILDHMDVIKEGNLSVYFKYPEDIPRVIYTTNIIESVHRQFRKLTKTKGAFPNENSLLKLFYMGIIDAYFELEFNTFLIGYIF